MQFEIRLCARVYVCKGRALYEYGWWFANGLNGLRGTGSAVCSDVALAAPCYSAVAAATVVVVASNGISSSSPPARPANNTSGRQQARLRGDVARITLSPPQRNVHTILLLRSPIASCPLAVPEQCSDCFFPCIRPACVAIGNITSLPTETPCEFRNIAPYRFSTSDEPAETVPATGTRVSSRLVKGTDLWPSRRKRTTFANHFIIVPASQRGDTIYMKFLDTVSPSLSRARSGSCKKLIEPFIGPATRCMISLKYQGFSFRNLLEQDIKILLQPTQEIATIQGNVTGYT